MSNIKEVAIAYWRLQKWIASVDVDRKIAAESSLRTLKDFLKENDVEVIDLTGKQYDPGLSVEVLFFEDEDADSENIPTIVEMTQPIIIQNSSVIEFGQVVIAKNPETTTSISNIESATEVIVNNDSIDIPKTNVISKREFKVLPLLLSIITITVCLTLFVSLIIQNKSIDNIDNKVSSIIKTQTKIDTEFNQYKEEMNKRIDDQTQKNTLPTSKDTDNENNKTDSVNWKVYIVKSGDTLSSVCSEYNIDYYAWQKIILSTNGINDANKIYVGQALLLPILMTEE
jgi:LysM repeat protein